MIQEGATTSGGMELIPVTPEVPMAFHQLGILVLDDSPSMQDPVNEYMTKAQARDAATGGLHSRLNASAQRRNFSLAGVDFASSAGVFLDPTPVVQIPDTYCFTPNNGGGGTFIDSGLREAQRIASDFLDRTGRDIPASVCIVVLSDGKDQEGTGCGPDETLEIARQIKQDERKKICCAYFATKGVLDPEAEDILRRVASNPVVGFKACYDAESLRGFFIASVSAGRSI